MSRATKAQKQHRREKRAGEERRFRGMAKSRRTRQRREMPRRRERIALDGVLRLLARAFKADPRLARASNPRRRG